MSKTNEHGVRDGKRWRISKLGVSKRRYIWVVEGALGKSLPEGALVHHVDGNSLNDHPTNLIVCPDESYHQLIHKRSEAFQESGHADWLKCEYCKVYDDPMNLALRFSRKPGRKIPKARHKSCHSKYEFDRNLRKANPCLKVDL